MAKIFPEQVVMPFYSKEINFLQSNVSVDGRAPFLSAFQHNLETCLPKLKTLEKYSRIEKCSYLLARKLDNDTRISGTFPCYLLMIICFLIGDDSNWSLLLLEV